MTSRSDHFGAEKPPHSFFFNKSIIKMKRYKYEDLLSMVKEECVEEFKLAYDQIHDLENGGTKEWMLDRICSHFGVSQDQIKSKKKNEEVVFPRQVFMAFSKVCYGDSLKSIGTIVGRDHSTVIYAKRAVQNDYLCVPARRKMIRGLISTFPTSEMVAISKYLGQ
jgi:hypothetical protein